MRDNFVLERSVFSDLSLNGKGEVQFYLNDQEYKLDLSKVEIATCQAPTTLDFLKAARKKFALIYCLNHDCMASYQQIVDNGVNELIIGGCIEFCCSVDIYNVYEDSLHHLYQGTGRHTVLLSIYKVNGVVEQSGRT